MNQNLVRMNQNLVREETIIMQFTHEIMPLVLAALVFLTITASAYSIWIALA
jgi:hypothetical protein